MPQNRRYSSDTSLIQFKTRQCVVSQFEGSSLLWMALIHFGASSSLRSFDDSMMRTLFDRSDAP